MRGSITDGSVWDADIADHRWNEGFNRNASPAASGSTTDCSGWVREASVSIAIQLTYSQEVDRETVATRIHSLVESIKELDPPLGLEYDEKRSEENVSAREVRIVLVPDHIGKYRTRLLTSSSDKHCTAIRISSIALPTGKSSATRILLASASRPRRDRMQMEPWSYDRG
jgi:hypothetical protein